MMRRNGSLMTIVALAFTVLMAAADLDGTWAFVVDTPGGERNATVIMKLEADGSMDGPKVKQAVQISMDLAKLGGLKDIMPTEELYSTQFKPVPTKP